MLARCTRWAVRMDRLRAVIGEDDARRSAVVGVRGALEQVAFLEPVDRRGQTRLVSEDVLGEVDYANPSVPALKTLRGRRTSGCRYPIRPVNPHPSA